MHLRAFLKPTQKTLLVIFVWLVTAGSGMPQTFIDIKPSPQQIAWHDLEFGVILHFGTNTFSTTNGATAPPTRKSSTPPHFNPDQWMEAIQSSGIKYVVFVAKHHDGFCLWPSA